MKVNKIKEIVKEVLSINLVDWLTKSQIELIEIEVEVHEIAEKDVCKFIFDDSVIFKCSLMDE
tara:strand:- start:291 stop:479 length:189 start_codon:yes stop_codon:yes gene_type:complete